LIETLSQSEVQKLLFEPSRTALSFPAYSFG
jgi:hypothetical protein